MNNELLVQKFQIGQRVRRANDNAFVIRVIYFTTDDRVLYASGAGYSAYEGDQLTLAPERKPYEPTERRVVTRKMKGTVSTFRAAAAAVPAMPWSTVSVIDYVNAFYRPETDAEMAARHAIERAKYDSQGDEA